MDDERRFEREPDMSAIAPMATPAMRRFGGEEVILSEPLVTNLRAADSVLKGRKGAEP
jgi:hypothetical protein